MSPATSTHADVIGTRFPRPDARAKAAGRVAYISDIEVPGMLHAAAVRSPHPRARVISFDKTEALRIPGVVAVLSADEFGEHHPLKGFPQSPAVQKLVTNSPMFTGDQVGAVVAESAEAAVAAADLVAVEYEVLVPLLDAELALTGVDQLYDDAPGNLAGPSVSFTRGDFEGALAQAARVFEHEFHTQRQCASTIEPMGCLCDWDADGRLRVTTHLDNLFHLREQMAQVLDIAEDRILVTAPEAMGASFGLKNSMLAGLEPLCAILSRHVGRPVRMLLSPEESLTTTVTRHPARIKLTTAVDGDGNLLARSADVLIDSGSAGFGYVVVNSMVGKWATLYRTPHLRFNGAAVYTNHVPAGAYRGVGTAQIHFAMESQIDEIARTLGIDPIDYRLRHTLREGDTLLGGTPVRALGVAECLDRGRAAIGWDTPLDRSSDRFARGRGMALGLHHAGFTGLIPGLVERSICRARLIDGGRRVAIHLAAIDKGQGAKATMLAIAAETLHCGLADVVLDDVDSSAPYDALGAEASRSTYVQGRAVQAACTQLAGHLVEAAARRWNVPAGQLHVRNGSVHTTEDTRLITFAELAAEHPEVSDVVAEATYQPDDHDPLPVISADFCEVEVDRLTGVVKVISFVAAQDIGRVINRLGAEGQVEGGVHHGIGFALSEGLEYEAGQPVNGNFVGYRVLMATDMPDITTILVERQDPEGGPFGAKGIGTGVIPAIAPTVANAIRDAVGVRPLCSPITPARIVAMLDEISAADISPKMPAAATTETLVGRPVDA